MSEQLNPMVNLGNRELHRQHSVMIQGGNVPRAKVMDQHLIDRYLMRGAITLRQHHAGEHLLQQAAAAGTWATGVKWDVSGGASSRPSYVPFGAFWFGGSMKRIRERFGRLHEYVTRAVICHQLDAAKHDRTMDALLDSLDFMADLRGSREPLRNLRRAIKKGTV